MRLSVVPDLHLNSQREERIAPITEDPPDYLVLAGDLCEFNAIEFWLNYLTEELPLTRIGYVPGNHDFWETHIPITDVQRQITRMREICSKLGVLFLPDKNMKVGEIEVVGSPLWYDYSFVSDDLFSSEALRSGVDPKTSQAWMDQRFINYGKMDAPSFCAYWKTVLEARLKEVADKFIVVTHTCPYTELNAHPYGLFSAYSGTTSCNDLLQAFDKQLVAGYCGHTHRKASFGKWINIGNDYEGPLRFASLDV